jgi:hypothetical protein
MIMILAATAGAFLTAKNLRYDYLADDYNVDFLSGHQSPCSEPCDLD